MWSWHGGPAVPRFRAAPLRARPLLKEPAVTGWHWRAEEVSDDAFTAASHKQPPIGEVIENIRFDDEVEGWEVLAVEPLLANVA